MNAFYSEKNTPLTQLKSELFTQLNIQIWIKREDLNHPTVQGNKWHKLKGNLEMALQQNRTSLLTFGGAYSNHIAACAAAAKFAGLNSLGFIRGEELQHTPEKWSHTLKKAAQNGMQLHFISRMQYRRKTQAEFLQRLQLDYPNAYILPEGGSNALAIQGFKGLMAQLESQCPNWTHLYTPVGTGGTLAGLVTYAKRQENRQIFGIPVLKQGEHLLPQIKNWIVNDRPNKWQLLTQYHGGGYAKLSKELQQFMNDFEQQQQILLDPVYTAKMIYGVYDQLKKQQIPSGSKVILLHTGGLQGRSTE